jgi:hypothetical protein
LIPDPVSVGESVITLEAACGLAARKDIDRDGTEGKMSG